MNRFDAVLFDLDGTLLYTLPDMCEAPNRALTRYGHPVRTLEEVRSFVGNGVRKLVERALPPTRRRTRKRYTAPMRSGTLSTGRTMWNTIPASGR